MRLSSLLFSSPLERETWPRRETRREEKQKQRKRRKGREGKRGREEERLGRKKKLKTQISLGRPHVTSSDIHPCFVAFIRYVFHPSVVVACDDAY